MFFLILFWQHGLLSRHANKSEFNIALRKSEGDVSCYVQCRLFICIFNFTKLYLDTVGDLIT